MRVLGLLFLAALVGGCGDREGQDAQGNPPPPGRSTGTMQETPRPPTGD